MIYLLSLISAAFVCAIAFIWKMSAIAKENRVKRADFPLRRLGGKEPLNIFFISDIHRRTVSEEIIREVEEHGVHMVVIGGDLAEQGVPFTRVEENIKRLTSLGKTYFVWGNNDYEVSQERLVRLFKTYGVTALRNESVIYDHCGQIINISGVDDLRLGFADYPEAVRKLCPGAPTLLVSHNPGIHHQIHEEDGIDLILSGHTHGGQIRIGRFGLYDIGGTGMVHQAHYLISNGYGTTRLPLRFGARPETHLIRLMPGQE
ncbi:metallophosphoesterase [Bacillus sonorensis]|uniref:metallophosphoesterase n=1 Tax=Bacillus sonorensis TaxID=119858 RepID=UPI001F2C4566|nr:metallophosphoesterase [Bacillus sonorensis]MCF7618031.1 metallophosphoesterase [Bacillus sonorensis]MCY8036094.1 metallophosphoesterase [Bacillus sonorensis]MCY8089651.1 metallophosphoesterase [Bacillus sonorensis]MCY8405157.1 metallophosphoesterase [Bacillus sonorensis]MEC1440218.1 metallophosphoesterase [Bacillus sonorensis]